MAARAQPHTNSRRRRVALRVGFEAHASKEASLAASKTKNPYLAAQNQRLRARRGPAKAVTAVGHSILTAAWHILTTGQLYRDLGGDYFTRQNPDRTTRRLVRELEALGHRVTLEPLEAAA